MQLEDNVDFGFWWRQLIPYSYHVYFHYFSFSLGWRNHISSFQCPFPKPTAVLSTSGISSLAVYLHTEYCHVLFFLISKFVYQHIKTKLERNHSERIPTWFSSQEKEMTPMRYFSEVRITWQKNLLYVSLGTILLSVLRRVTLGFV